MHPLLLVEDDKSIRDVIHSYLTQNGFTVEVAANGKEAMERLQSKSISMLITDVMMPGVDGFQLANHARQLHPELPIIMLTALDQLVNKERGFVSGVDDYLTKPIELKELLLRIRALLRRAQIHSAQEIKIGSIHLDLRNYTCEVNKKIVELTKKEFELLFKLLSAPNTIFTRSQLMDEIWGFDSESYDRTIDTHIKRIRELVITNDFSIVTIRGLGYKAVIQ